VKEGVQGNGGANDEDVWWCFDGPKRAGRTRQNDKMGEANKRQEDLGSEHLFVFGMGEQRAGDFLEKGGEPRGLLVADYLPLR